MQLSTFQQPARGAYSRLEELVALRFAASSLSLQRKNRALSLLSGPNKSNFRGRGIDLPNWLFLSGDQGAIDRLADAVGFTITPSAGGFDHSAQVSVIDADGRVYQQIRGGVFNPPAVVEPLKDLMFGQRRTLASLEGITERIKLFCTVYNPNTGRYYFNYSLFIGLGIGIACLLLVLIWLVREFRLPDGGAHP